MGIEFKNVTMITKEQHDAMLAANRTEQYRAIALEQEQQIAALKCKVKKMRKERKALVSDIEGYVKVANEYAVENDSLVRQLSTATRQLSEALGKIREYREAEERVESARKAPAAFKALALVEMLKSFADRASRESEFFKRTGAGIKDVGGRTDDELRPLKDRLIEVGCVGPIAAKIATAYERQPPWGTKAERVLIQIVMKGQFSRDDFLMLLETAPWVFQSVRAACDALGGQWEGSLPIDGLVAQMWEPDNEVQTIPKQDFATGGYVGGSRKFKVGEVPVVLSSGYVIPHHGPGLSEAEDAYKSDSPDKEGENDGVSIQYQGEPKHSHYKKDISNLSMLDIYRVLSLFEVRSHAVGHAIKKLIMAGKRGSKGYEQDIREAVDSLNRELQMIAEDGK